VKRSLQAIAVGGVVLAELLSGCSLSDPQTHTMVISRTGSTPGKYGDIVLEGTETKTDGSTLVWRVVCDPQSEFECALIKPEDKVEFTIDHGYTSNVHRVS
jgi:hypothetical protein